MRFPVGVEQLDQEGVCDTCVGCERVLGQAFVKQLLHVATSTKK